MAKKLFIKVQDIEIGIKNIDNQDYICLTDIAKGQEGDDHIRNWMRNRNTLEYLGVWEGLHNPDFKGVEFDTFRKQSGLNSFNMTPKKWADSTDAIGIISTAGKYGGTYAHKDIAFNFAMWISPVFQLYIIKEYQRLKEIESNEHGLEWNVRRILTKANYTIHTDAVKNYIIPKTNFSKAKEWLLYAGEADLLNIALFGCTAKEWQEANPARALQGENIRDMASINELAILSTIESLNAALIKNGLDRKSRFQVLLETVKDQKATLDKIDVLKSIKKISETTFLDYKKNKNNNDEK
ncbi:KilA-N domain-containing protein [Chryseobacterium sp. MYb264]|uniref:KilA-N domain-containing protein n=1 Tax=Chryseobacterium sp. MYb264 TaxID=2745153 RepID=UPI002E13492A|nr:KilA-N domain-containing protein [Chryseobacterium sp. MYb264]